MSLGNPPIIERMYREVVLPLSSSWVNWFNSLVKEVGTYRLSTVVISTVLTFTTDKIQTVVCNKATPMTITLPATIGSYKIIEIKNIGAGTATVSNAGSDTIDGGGSQSVLQWECLVLQDYAVGSWIIK